MRLSLIMKMCLYLQVASIKAIYNSRNTKYSNVWVARIIGGEEVVERIARDLGYNYQGQLGIFKDYYELKKRDHPEVSLSDSDHLTRILRDLEEVKWVKQQKLIHRISDGLYQYTEEADEDIVMSLLNDEAAKQSKDSIESLYADLWFPYRIQNYLKSLNQGDVHKLGSISTKPAPASQLNTYTGPTKNIGLLSRKLSAYAVEFKDPYWRKQWYMQDYRTSDGPVMDLNVVPVYRMGYTGKGITVAVLDDGIFHNNPDLTNLDTSLSFDYCDNIPGCKPKTSIWTESHGTQCAGVIGMTARNGRCGVGIAFDAKLVGIRAICDRLSVESTQAKELTHKLEVVDIYSNSWSYNTAGYNLFYLDEFSELAYETGATKGRGGKGAIYVHSSGNFKLKGDNCAYDCNINQPYVITIAAASQWGKTTMYSERCPAIMATGYSRHLGSDGVVATDGSSGCIRNFHGTSSTCPQGAAIIALALQANPKLTYRDVMHLVTMSSEVAPLADNENMWYKNGRGFWVSNDFGFGLLNGENMVTLAKTWKNVPARHTCIVSISIPTPEVFGKEQDAYVYFETTACEGSENEEVNYLEQIEVIPTISFPRRGLIELYIESPVGTRTQLLEPRYKDTSKDGLDEWSIMSTHNWGEDPKGKWKIQVKSSLSSKPRHKGFVHELKVVFHGTAEKPAHYHKPRQYAAFRLPDGQESEPT